MPVANAEMAKAWDGEEGERWADNAERYEKAGGAHWERFLATGLIAAGDRVLDVGCGTGKSTRDAARLAAAGSALGVDLSARMLERARERSAAEGLVNVEFLQADAQVHPFEQGSFDVAISSFGAMFFDDPVAAFSNIGRSLRGGGRLALLAWRGLRDNEWLMAFRSALAVGRALPEPPPGAPGPFGLADADRAREVVAGGGFDHVELDRVDEPVYLGADADDAFAFAVTMGIVKGLTHDLDEATRARAMDELRRVLADHDTGHGVLFGSSAWLITAHRPG